MTLALFEQTDRTMYIIMDSDTYPTGDEVNNFGETVNDLVAAGRALRPTPLRTWPRRSACRREPGRHRCRIQPLCRGRRQGRRSRRVRRSLFSTPIDNGPFYAAARVPTVHHTMGGVVIDVNCHVLDESGNIISGLYAAGEVTGGIHGSNAWAETLWPIPSCSAASQAPTQPRNNPRQIKGGAFTAPPSFVQRPFPLPPVSAPLCVPKRFYYPPLSEPSNLRQRPFTRRVRLALSFEYVCSLPETHYPILLC